MTSVDPHLPSASDVPLIWCPIIPAVHPWAEGADDRLFEWAERFDLVRGGSARQRFHSAGFGNFCAETYPRAVGEQGLDLMSEWNGYNWILDDLIDEGYATFGIEECQRICRDVMAQMPVDMRETHPSKPLLNAIADLWRRTAGPMSLAWRRRYVAHYHDWLSGSLLPHLPSTGESNKAPLSLTTFSRRRRIHSGCELSFDLLEPGNQEEVPEAVVNCDTYKSIRLSASDAIAWTNDLYSIRKEMARGNRDHLVAHLCDTEHLTWADALAKAVRMVEDSTLDFVRACDDLRERRRVFAVSDEEWQRVEGSLTDLGYWLSGSLHWHSWSPRYRVVEERAQDARPSYIESHLT